MAASASPAMLILNQKQTSGYWFSATGNCPRSPLSHLTTQAIRLSQIHP